MKSFLISFFKFFYLFNDILIDFFGLDKKELYESLNYGEFSDNESVPASEVEEKVKEPKSVPEPEPAADHKVEVTSKSEVTYEKTIRITLDLLVGANGLGFILPPGTMPIHSQSPPAPQPEPPKPDIQPEPAPTINLCDTKVTLDFGSQVPQPEETQTPEEEEEDDDATHSSMPDLEPISEEDEPEMNKEINSKYDFVDEYLEQRRSVIPDFQLKKYAKKISEEDIGPHTNVINASVANDYM